MNTKNASGAATTARELDPDLSKRLAEVRSHKERQLRLRERIRRERRILLPALAFSLIAHFNLGTARVEGHSMEPTLHTGDTLFVWKSYHYFEPIKAGDLVTVRMQHSHIKGDEIVKRVVFVQNATGTAKWPTMVRTRMGEVDPRMFFPSYVRGQLTVPPNGILVLGDNYENSMDSRDFGPIGAEEIDGKVLNR